MLCDAASVRDNVLNVLGGGLTNFVFSELPSTLGANLAVLLEMSQEDAVADHTVTFELLDENEKKVAHMGAELSRLDLSPDEVRSLAAGLPIINVPLAVPVGGFTLESAGAHRLIISVDGAQESVLWLRVGLVDDQSA